MVYIVAAIGMIFLSIVYARDSRLFMWPRTRIAHRPVTVEDEVPDAYKADSCMK